MLVGPQVNAEVLCFCACVLFWGFKVHRFTRVTVPAGDVKPANRQGIVRRFNADPVNKSRSRATTPSGKPTGSMLMSRALCSDD